LIGHTLPPELAKLYSQKQLEIRARLCEFETVLPKDRFYELCFCLLTPQSSAVHANAVVESLKCVHYQEDGQDVLHLLRQPNQYIRFHNTKHARLIKARRQWPAIAAIVDRYDISPVERRDLIAQTVDGFGLKESSHFLRNIGVRGLAILDRHLLTNLVRCGVYGEVPSVSTISRYKSVEKQFIEYCLDIGIDIDEVDLLFWCAQTGFILK